VTYQGGGRVRPWFQSADFDGDGRTDVAAMRNSHTAVIFLNQGMRKFVPTPEFTVGRGNNGLVAADLSQDGKPDLVIGGGAVLSDTLVWIRPQSGGREVRGCP
jgi:hypothetical protein